MASRQAAQQLADLQQMYSLTRGRYKTKHQMAALAYSLEARMEVLRRRREARSPSPPLASILTPATSTESLSEGDSSLRQSPGNISLNQSS